MGIPQSLINIIEIAKKEILFNEKGELILPMRIKIWKALGPYKIDSNNRAILTVGLKRRVKLASMCVEKNIDIWNSVLADDQRPLIMLEIVEDYIRGNVDYDFVQKQIGRFTTDLENLSCDERYNNASLVGFAALRTVSLALRDEKLMISGKDNLLDDDYDAYSWDASFYSALAYSGSGSWDNANIAERREFWLWYIEEAVPKAFISYQE
ncbi:Imm5 family immunity protein [Acetivibrio clariflavus]|uniref:Immunity protein Imm5 domain-containing protein n=1 Tax=Acetivibrio clariflavus (strain DSM 19732 / NBRC 101661 / EBR45) TaxID=720554 RepID=G8M2X9_ACECE|nr:Imm5 family immunity protein [Acetivibrio clariflavus]AEV68243.1 hypothetical protein Clocl_1612 [Acetivibrio clariflavus DSM 19732]